MVASNGTSTFVLFLYADIQWIETGGMYREYFPQVGFDSGFGSHISTRKYYRLPNTGTRSGLEGLASSTNIGREGMWGFKISGPAIRNITCVTGTGIVQVELTILC